MFTKADFRWFGAALLLIISGLLLMRVDPADNGFGILTLTIAPPVLLAGFAAFIPGLVGTYSIGKYMKALKRERYMLLTGGLVFLASTLVYLLSLEPTASLWDCSEFIASAYKLQIPHTPGNPLLLLVGRVFAMMAPSTATVAVSVNAMSAVFSGATVTLVYILISLLARRMYPDASHLWIGTGAMAGSFCVAFSDTFWFSAVEAETYAASCFFFMLLVLLIVLGSNIASAKRGRLMILIFYFSGLGFCIHPMCMLALPLLPVVWITGDRGLTLRTFGLSITAGLLIVLTINRVVAVGVFEAAFFLDKALVNGLSLPFYSGAVLLVFSMVITGRILLQRLPQYSAYTWSAAFLLFGFLPYLVLFVRSGHNPPIDEANPENLQLIKAYMNREGYPTRPLLYGQYFDAEVTGIESSNMAYYKDEGGYEVAGSIPSYEYEPTRQTILPRIYSQDADHIAAYRAWTGMSASDVPGFKENLLFMFRYQLGHMYLRYLLFNFAGRESDVQNSDWLAVWESAGDRSHPQYNRARNQYWSIPLLIGLVGAITQFRRHRAGFSWVGTAFLMTGFLLAIYLNSTPNEPRERDYIYVASYVAFGVWMGLGFVWMMVRFSGYVRYALFIFSIAVPAWMLYQNWDDHDRSGRTFQMDYARQVLNECKPGALLFTGGDNDTFPLWYLQEVEGFRTDVRVVVLSYLNTDWYINQLRKRYYNSVPFQLSLSPHHYRQYGPNDVLYVQKKIRDRVNTGRLIDLLRQEHQALRVPTADGDYYNVLPSDRLVVPINISEKNSGALMELEVKGHFLSKNGLAIIDLIMNNPDRPFYFNFTSMQQAGFNIEDYLVQEGQLFHLRPDKGRHDGPQIDSAISYEQLVENGSYENLLNQGVYFNHEDFELRMITPLRQSFNSLAAQLINEGEIEKAETTLEAARRYFYQPRFQPGFTNLHCASLLAELGQTKEAEGLVRSLYLHNAQLIEKGIASQTDLQLQHYATELLAQLGAEE